jgi:hypothetical protein
MIANSEKRLRWLAWSAAGLTITLMTAGLALQAATESPLGGLPFLIHISEVFGLSGFAVIGALIVTWHPRHPVGWIWLLISFSFGVDHFAWGYAHYGEITRPGSLPGAAAAIVWLYWTGRGTFGLLGMTLLLLLFPGGRPLSSRWSIVAWIAVARAALSIPIAALVAVPFGEFPFATDLVSVNGAQAVLEPIKQIPSIAGLILFGAAMFSLISRFKRANGVERQQIKWFVFAAALLIPAFILILVAGFQQGPEFNFRILLGPLFGVTASIGMAAASAIAITRYRLWDIDLIIRRTLIFGILTGALVFVYFLGIVLFRGIFQSLSGQNSPMAIVLSTLAIAALFTPLRRRIQGAIDRRFYRSKYNAEQTLASFSTLTREHTDLDDLASVLLRVVRETVLPDSISLWLKRPGKN